MSSDNAHFTDEETEIPVLESYPMLYMGRLKYREQKGFAHGREFSKLKGSPGLELQILKTFAADSIQLQTMVECGQWEAKASRSHLSPPSSHLPVKQQS